MGKGLAWAVFESHLFLYKYSNILNPSHSSYLPVYEDVTECSETLVYTIQTPGNYPEESIQQHATTVSSHVTTSPKNDKLTTCGRKTSVNVTYNKTNTPTVNSVGTNT